MKEINCKHYVPAWEGSKTSNSQPDFCLKHKVSLRGECIKGCEFSNMESDGISDMDNMEIKREIYKKALNKWGAEAQIIMVFEEMAELQKELCKVLRNNYSLDDLAEEIADVEIMLEQMKILFMIEKSVQEQKKYKLQRLIRNVVLKRKDV